MWYLIYTLIFASGISLSVIAIAFFRKIALASNFVDYPDEARKTHQEPIPLLGGAGMFLAFLSGIALNLGGVMILEKLGILPDSLRIFFDGIIQRLPQLLIIIATSFVILLMGLIDDRKKLSAGTKLAIEIILGIIVFLNNIRITLFIDNIFLNALLTIAWIIGITNAFNLLDNMDGLSAGTAFISGLAFFMIAAIGEHFFVAAILALFLGIVLGFLRVNFPPAKMFMGDAGSLFIGYTLSLLTIINTYYRQPDNLPATVIMPVIIMAIPIFDTLSVIWIRIRARISIFTADNNHISHRLVRLGFSKREAVLFIYLLNFTIGLSALLLGAISQNGSYIVIVQALAILSIIIFLEKVRGK